MQFDNTFQRSQQDVQAFSADAVGSGRLLF